jgi:hypothetical protein
MAAMRPSTTPELPNRSLIHIVRSYGAGLNIESILQNLITHREQLVKNFEQRQSDNKRSGFEKIKAIQSYVSECIIRELWTLTAEDLSTIHTLRENADEIAARQQSRPLEPPSEKITANDTVQSLPTTINGPVLTQLLAFQYLIEIYGCAMMVSAAHKVGFQQEELIAQLNFDPEKRDARLQAAYTKLAHQTPYKPVRLFATEPKLLEILRAPSYDTPKQIQVAHDTLIRQLDIIKQAAIDAAMTAISIPPSDEKNTDMTNNAWQERLKLGKALYEQALQTELDGVSDADISHIKTLSHYANKKAGGIPKINALLTVLIKFNPKTIAMIDAVYNSLYNNNQKFLSEIDDKIITTYFTADSAQKSPALAALQEKKQTIQNAQAILATAKESLNPAKKLHAIKLHTAKMLEYSQNPKYEDMHRDPWLLRWLSNALSFLILPIALYRMRNNNMEFGSVKFWQPQHSKHICKQKQETESLSDMFPGTERLVVSY